MLDANKSVDGKLMKNSGELGIFPERKKEVFSNMKTRKRVTSFLLALAIAFAIIITPNYDAKAATYVYAPGRIIQTSATKKEIKFVWEAGTNATSYNVYVRLGGPSGQIWTAANLKSNGAVLKGVKPGVQYYVEIFSVGADGKVSSYSSTKTVYAAPAKPKGVYLDSWYSSTNNMTVKWSGYNSNQVGYYCPDGYEVKVMTLAGKNIKTFKVSSQYLSKTINSIKDAGFKVKIRSYYVVNQYSSYAKAFKTYSAWSDVKAFVPQPKMGATYRTRETTANFSWKPIKNASSYTVYGIKKVGNSYKYTKFKTVPASVTSVTVPRSLGKVTVFPTVKVGGRTYKATYKDRYTVQCVNLPY